MNKNERDGKIDQVKGNIKQAVATVTGDEKLKTEGKADVAIGKVEEAVGKATRKVAEAVTSVANAAKH
jgi:uncharacterized protein YjbJ (UPF0337 family)